MRGTALIIKNKLSLLNIPESLLCAAYCNRIRNERFASLREQEIDFETSKYSYDGGMDFPQSGHFGGAASMLKVLERKP
jgi:hypothetical protein